MQQKELFGILKNHLIAGLCTCDSRFLAAYLDKNFPQAIITLNLLRSARLNSSLSTHAEIFGNFNFNETPLAPPGTKVVVHHNKITTSGIHSLDGWYVGPSMNHYRCYTCVIPSTGGKMYADTVDFFPENVSFPTVTSEQYLHEATTDILIILQSPEKSIPSLTYGSPITNTYIQVAQILKRATSQPVSHPTSTKSSTPGSFPRVPKATHAPLPRVSLQDTEPLPRVLNLKPTSNKQPSPTSEPTLIKKSTKQTFTQLHGPHSKKQTRRPYPVLNNRHAHFT